METFYRFKRLQRVHSLYRKWKKVREFCSVFFESDLNLNTTRTLNSKRNIKPKPEILDPKPQILHQSYIPGGAQKIRARIQTCLQSRAGSGTCARRTLRA